MSDYARPPAEKDAKGRHAFAEHVGAYESGWRTGVAEGMALAVSFAVPAKQTELAERCAVQAERRGLGEDFRRECRRRGITW